MQPGLNNKWNTAKWNISWHICVCNNSKQDKGKSQIYVYMLHYINTPFL